MNSCRFRLILLALLLAALAGYALRAAAPEPAAADATNLKTKLTPMQYHVTKENGTEPPFHNEYWDNHRDGIYVCVISGAPLFSSKDKFDSGTGWPSFSKALEPDNLTEVADHSLGMTRGEIRSVKGDSHLGHLFDDGPAPTHLRYCMNSAALRFVPAEDLAKAGYDKYVGLFKTADAAKTKEAK